MAYSVRITLDARKKNSQEDSNKEQMQSKYISIDIFEEIPLLL